MATKVRTSKSPRNTLRSELKPGQTRDAAGAEMMVDGLGMNAVTAAAYSQGIGELDPNECMTALIAETRKVQSGDWGGPEALLAAEPSR